MANQLRRSLKNPMGQPISQAPSGGKTMAASTYLDNKYPQAKGKIDIMYEERSLNAERNSNLAKTLSTTGGVVPLQEGGSAANTSTNPLRKLGAPKMGRR